MAKASIERFYREADKTIVGVNLYLNVFHLLTSKLPIHYHRIIKIQYI